MTYYRDKYGWQDGAFPVAAQISDCSIALPVAPHLDVDDMNYIGTHSGAARQDGRLDLGAGPKIPSLRLR